MSQIESRKAELIRLLEAELDVIEAGAYAPPAGKPYVEKPLFYESLACINHWLIPGREAQCNEDCLLMDFVPQGRRNERLPCHHIVLNEAGDTVNSLEARGDRSRLEEEVKRWLRTVIKRLNNEGEPEPT